MPDDKGHKRNSDEILENNSCKKTNQNESLCFISDEENNEVAKKLEQEPDDNEKEKKYFNGVEVSKLSKRQMKKYQKCMKWEEVKKEKRLKERLKLKQKRIHAKLNNIDLGPSRKELKMFKMKDSPCKIHICIDLGFDDLMIDKDMAKTVKQILRVYTENRRSKAPMQLHLSNFNGRSEKEMAKHHGFENWDINFHKEDYIKVFPKNDLIYLSSESENVLTQLEQNKVYIIGGLVDHNSQKGICYNKAVEQGVVHAKLPIEEYFWMKHRKVLTINQVFEILLRVSEGNTFKEAFELILPKRIEKLSTDELPKTSFKKNIENEPCDSKIE
nr:tRNA methyltransferase 10 homolog A isoform X1 [Leptinotarsa decemlineata]